jgi:hypothetical protein
MGQSGVQRAGAVVGIDGVVSSVSSSLSPDPAHTNSGSTQ